MKVKITGEVILTAPNKKQMQKSKEKFADMLTLWRNWCNVKYKTKSDYTFVEVKNERRTPTKRRKRSG